VIQRSEELRGIKEKYNSAVIAWQLGQSFIRYTCLYIREHLQKLVLNMNVVDLHFIKIY